MNHIFLASDSTCQAYDTSKTNQAGWGQFLGEYLADYEIHNHAIGGRSSKTFIEEGRLNAMKDKMKSGDYLLVQMGHNDSTKEKPERFTEPYLDYKQYLKQYIDIARNRQAIPILITPVARMHYVLGEFLIDFNDYCNAMKEVAAEEKVQIIDLMKHSIQHYQKVGYKEVYTYYMAAYNGKDYTHFTIKGANQIAKIVAERFLKII